MNIAHMWVWMSTRTRFQLQLRFRVGISPMIWRRVLVPETMSLHELHGVLQVAMGWKAIHLFQFSVRGVTPADAMVQIRSTPHAPDQVSVLVSRALQRGKHQSGHEESRSLTQEILVVPYLGKFKTVLTIYTQFRLLPICSGLRSSDAVLEIIADLDSDYLRLAHIAENELTCVRPTAPEKKAFFWRSNPAWHDQNISTTKPVAKINAWLQGAARLI